MGTCVCVVLFVLFCLCRHHADWTAGRTIRGSNPGGDKRFVFTSKRLDRLWAHGGGGGGRGRGVRLTTPSRVVPRFRLSGAIYQLPPYAFLVCAGTTLCSYRLINIHFVTHLFFDRQSVLTL